MPTRDSNNATWYLLRYEEDFTPPPGASAADVAPEIHGPLSYDPARHVLELLPAAPVDPVRPLSGLAVDVNGEIYRVNPRSHQLLVRRCDGSEAPLLCEPGVLLRPAGLALDRRGFLYVADPAARRVVVLQPDEGRIVAVLAGGGLSEPVDVAVAPNGRIYVADRASKRAEGGRMILFDPRFNASGNFIPRNDENLPEVPRPIAVMIDADGSVLVADASHPRLLCFAPDGSPKADVELTTLARGAQGVVDPSVPETAYGSRLPRFRVGACPPPLADRDGGAQLAEVHRALRLLRLRLGRRFETEGIFLSRALNGGTPGVSWHRVEIEGEIPEGTSVVVETATAETGSDLDETHADWSAPMRNDAPIPMTRDVNEHLIGSPPGRYLRLRVTLRSDGRETPALRSIRVLFPRVSYLDLLPNVYRRDPEGEQFLERFLALFERVLTGVEDRYVEFSRELNPDAAPREVIDWLACLVDLAFDPSWSLEKRRALVAEAMDLYRTRGTVRGLQRYVEIYTGTQPTIREAFLEHPPRPVFLGGTESILGCSFALTPGSPDLPADMALASSRAHRFTVLVYLDDPCDEEVILPVVDRIVSVNKPAHTVHSIQTVQANARVGAQSTVGIDLVLGGREAPSTVLDGHESGEGRVSVLGVDSVLGERRPSYVRPIVPDL